MVDNGNGSFTYTSEDGTVTTFTETTTSLSQALATGVITYTDENGATQTANVISTDAGNIISVGADGGAYVDNTIIAASETTTTLVQDDVTGDATYTNEDGLVTIVDVISTDAGNVIAVGSDGAAYLSQSIIASNETVTTLVDNGNGSFTYTNEAGVVQTVSTVSSDNDNQIVTGLDGGPYINSIIKEVFSAEYAGATLFADGTNNIGTMTSDNAGAANSYMNYYEWSSGEVTAQDYDVIFRFTLPNNFTAWDTTNPIVIDFQAQGAATFSASMFLENGTALGTIAPTSSATWTTAVINPGTMTAGQTAVIILKMTSAPNDNTQKVRIGDITLNYKL